MQQQKEVRLFKLRLRLLISFSAQFKEEIVSIPHKMKKVIPLYILYFLTIILLISNKSLGDARAQTIQLICANKGVENGSIHVSNFVTTMENISSQIRNSGFGLAITGTGINSSFGLAQCYGDMSSVDCTLCYAEARTILPRCYPNNGGRIYLDGCFMRTYNSFFFDEYEGPQDRILCGNTTIGNSNFGNSVRNGMGKVVESATNGKGYARFDGPAAYILSDCWKTVNSSGCRKCLERASESLLGCLPFSEGRALYTGCFMRYSDTNFLNPLPGKENSRGKTMVIVGAVVSSVIVLIIVGLVGVYIWKCKVIKNKRKGSNDAEKMIKTLHDSSFNFKYSSLEKATDSFDDANKLGQGGFGIVYKGVLSDGREIAIKRLFLNNMHKSADFYNEVITISSVEHKNLVRLLGCSCSGPESLLVYEFLPNLSLDRYIFSPEKGKSLNWEKRYRIIIGIAEGLVYLHENAKFRIIHRDIKASNILLDSKMRAKIADFGLARSFQEDKSHVSTAIAGTLGYMSPEYLAHGQLSEKVDVFSFGVLLLEIVTGKQNNMSQNTEHSQSLVTIVWKHFQQGTTEPLFDPNLMLHDYNYDNNTKNELSRVIHIGLLCTQEVPSLRPSMSKALKMLANFDEILPTPTNPPFIDENTMELTDACENSFESLNCGNLDSVATFDKSTSYRG